MKKWLGILIAILFILCSNQQVNASNVYPALGALTGGGTGALDKISHSILSDGDAAIVILNTQKVYFYTLSKNWRIIINLGIKRI